MVSIYFHSFGFIHSHPKAAPGFHNDFHSNPDLFLLNLPGISEVYVVPYSCCQGVPKIIAGSQENTWNTPTHRIK